MPGTPLLQWLSPVKQVCWVMGVSVSGMNDHRGCKKILLSGQSAFKVYFCETHRTVELEVGVMSLRLDEEALVVLSNSLRLAVTNLQAVDASRDSFDAFMRQLKSS